MQCFVQKYLVEHRKQNKSKQNLIHCELKYYLKEAPKEDYATPRESSHDWAINKKCIRIVSWNHLHEKKTNHS